MRRSKWLSGRPMVLGALVAVVVGLSAAPAAADQFKSMAAAAAAGDPAAVAPVYTTPGIFRYEGGQISEAEVIAKELPCLQTAENFRCFNTEAELQAATEGSATEAFGEAAGQVECGGGISQLYTWSKANFGENGGILATLEATGGWFNFRLEMENETTSFRMGERAGHMSENPGGGGNWYPGPTSACAQENNIYTTRFPEWNDRISSRYRIP